MCPPSSELVLFALRIVAIAFQRTMLPTRRSSASSTGSGGSSCGGIVFRYGVVPAGAGAAPVGCAWPTTRSSRNCARCAPSLATTASSASSHSRVSWGSTSTCDAIAAPDLLGARPLWLIRVTRRRFHDTAESIPLRGMWDDSPMARLGTNQYGKAETHLVRVYREGETHEIRDLTVSVALGGELDAVHLEGDNAAVLATDTQKNTVYAFAKEHPVGTPEAFAARLARHFLGGAITPARVHVGKDGWTRLSDHTFTQASREQRIAVVVAEPDGDYFASGIAGLVVLKTTDSEFHG